MASSGCFSSNRPPFVLTALYPLAKAIASSINAEACFLNAPYFFFKQPGYLNRLVGH